MKISVIVPIYNSEAYLKDCIESIVNQTYKSLEIILVNDGSTDNSLSICNEYNKIDSRIIVISQENKGVSAARNKGLALATGEYIGFVDSDDFISLEMYEKLLKSAQKYNAEISECGYIQCKPDGSDIKKFPLKRDLLNNNYDCVYSFLSRNNTTNFNVNKLYKADLIKNIRYPNYKYSEDYWFNAKAVYSCQKKVTIAEPHYYYVQHPNSAVRGPFKFPDKMDVFRSGEAVYKIYENRESELRSLIAFYLCNYVLNYYYFFYINNMKVKDKYINEMKRIYNEYNSKIIKKDLSRRYKVYFRLFNINIRLYLSFRKLYERFKHNSK